MSSQDVSYFIADGLHFSPLPFAFRSFPALSQDTSHPMLSPWPPTVCSVETMFDFVSYYLQLSCENLELQSVWPLRPSPALDMKIVLPVGAVQSLDKIIKPLIFVAFSYGQMKAAADWGGDGCRPAQNSSSEVCGFIWAAKWVTGISCVQIRTYVKLL